MKTFLFENKNNKWELLANETEVLDNEKINLVLCFAQKNFLENTTLYTSTKAQFPNAEIVFCSTAGQIVNQIVSDKDGILIAMEFAKTKLESASINIADCENSFDAAYHLVKKLPSKDLTYIMVFCDGSLINGSELVKGLCDAAEKGLKISGGLAGDGSNFISTLVGLNHNPKQGEIVVVGFYGNAIAIENGSKGGWTPFGLEKRITKSVGNILHELENENALDIYKKYLGSNVSGLPSSALLFPLSITLPNTLQPVVRTILSINEEEKTMTFAGDMPEGSKVRFMRSKLEDLTKAASTAATISKGNHKKVPDFSLLISCVGRKLIMGLNVKDEVQAVINTLGKQTKVAGFYSYGEIAPFNDGGCCQLHNQTMTITSFFEAI